MFSVKAVFQYTYPMYDKEAMVDEFSKVVNRVLDEQRTHRLARAFDRSPEIAFDLEHMTMEGQTIRLPAVLTPCAKEQTNDPNAQQAWLRALADSAEDYNMPPNFEYAILDATVINL